MPRPDSANSNLQHRFPKAQSEFFPRYFRNIEHAGSFCIQASIWYAYCLSTGTCSPAATVMSFCGMAYFPPEVYLHKFLQRTYVITNTSIRVKSKKRTVRDTKNPNIIKKFGRHLSLRKTGRCDFYSDISTNLVKLELTSDTACCWTYPVPAG